MRKRVLLSIIVFIMLVNIFVSDFNVYAEEMENLSVDEIISEAIKPYLDDLYWNRETYGMEDVDFTKLYLGTPINSYTNINNSLVKDISVIYPVIYENEIIYNFITAVDGNGNRWIQFTDFFVDELNEQYRQNKEVAVVLDTDTYYMCSDNDITAIEQLPEKVVFNTKQIKATTNVLEAKCEQTDINENIIKTESRIAYTPSTTRASGITLSVSTVGQGSYASACWLASANCVGNYVVPSLKMSLSGLGNKWGAGWSTVTGTVSGTAQALKVGYNLTYQYKTSAPTQAIIRKNLEANYPLCVIWGATKTNIYSEVGTSFTHMCAVFGIASDNSYIWVMDPWGTNAERSGYKCTASWNGSNYTCMYTWADTTYPSYISLNAMKQFCAFYIN